TEQIAMLLKSLAMSAYEIDAAQNLEYVVHGAKVRISLLGLREHVPERMDTFLENAADVLVDRRAAKVCRNRDTHTAEICLREHIGNAQGIIAGERVALVEIDLRLQQQMQVRYRTAHRTIDREG